MGKGKERRLGVHAWSKQHNLLIQAKKAPPVPPAENKKVLLAHTRNSLSWSCLKVLFYCQKAPLPKHPGCILMPEPQPQLAPPQHGGAAAALLWMRPGYPSSSFSFWERARPPFRGNSAACVCDLRLWTTPPYHKWREENKRADKFAFSTTDMHAAWTLGQKSAGRSSWFGQDKTFMCSCAYIVGISQAPLSTQPLSLSKGQHSQTQQLVLGKPQTFLSLSLGDGDLGSIFGGAGWDTMSKSQSHRYLTTGSVPGSGPVNTSGRIHWSLVCFIIRGLLKLPCVCSFPLQPI